MFRIVVGTRYIAFVQRYTSDQKYTYLFKAENNYGNKNNYELEYGSVRSNQLLNVMVVF